MDNNLLLVITITGMLAIYWVLFGQWKHNKMMRQADKQHILPEKEIKETAKENEKKQ